MLLAPHADWLLASDQLSHAASVAWGDLLAPAALGFLIAVPLVAWWRDRRRARAAERAEAGHTDEGLTVVKGRVVTEGQGPAVTVEIDQRGRQRSNKQGPFIEWSEAARKVSAHPFWVEPANGRRVRVEPDERVFLVDKLETVARGRAERARIATLTDGEPVHVIGLLTSGFDPMGGYRDADAPVLRPERAGRMLVSTEPLADRHRRRARFHARWGFGGGALVLLLGLALFAKFLALQLDGRTVDAQIDRVYTFITTSKSGRHTHYAVQATYTDERGPHVVWDETNYSAWRSLAPGQTEPFRVWPRTGWNQLGSSASVSMVSVLFLIQLLILFGVLYSIRARATRPWYDRKRLVETERGKLPA